MGNVFEGHLVATDLKIGIVVGRFNEFITSKLLSGAQDAFIRHGHRGAMWMLHGFLELLKYRLRQSRWPIQESTMQLSH